MSKLRDDEIAHWLREAREETQPTDPIPVPQQHQHAQQPITQEDSEGGSTD